MNEKKLINEQLLKGVLLNFIAFTVIFTIFAITIFTTLKVYIYSSSNNELLKEKERYLMMDSFPPKTIKAKEDIGKPDIKTDNIRQMQSPRIIQIEWSTDGKIVTEEAMGEFYKNYTSEITLNKNNLNTIYEITLNNQYKYRTITFETTTSEGETRYIQLLINVDSESEILNNFLSILSIGTILTILLSIIASYLLSKMAMKPVVRSMEKQTEFVQNASHELRTPLTIIQAKQELLLQEPDAKIVDKAEEIMLTLNETKRLTKMTKDLMLLARSDSNTMNIQKEKTDIDEMIKEITKPYSEIAEMEDKKLILNLNYKEKINIDSNKIHQVLIILLDNALKYTEKKDIIEVITENKEGKCIIYVKDTGIGIKDEAINHVFERFYREDKARQRESGGSGLGLAIANCIVQAHNGVIKATHNTPKGTIFSIKLPK
ncbi:MAG: HAMP domain-containing histidine kinase [Clostridia bacterium]|nr:HAMP domain-containing histidine kinase [Clostridia bacterium]